MQIACFEAVSSTWSIPPQRGQAPLWRLAGCVGGNVCESNTSKTFCTPHNGFEDRGAHRSPSVPKRGGILPNAQCRATKTAHLLRLTSKGKPYPLFRNIGKSSTCGFVFAVFEMVEGSHLNVVDRPVLWRAAIRSLAQGSESAGLLVERRKTHRIQVLQDANGSFARHA